MSIGLVSAKISGQAVQRTQSTTPAHTSTADDAKYIAKTSQIKLQQNLKSTKKRSNPAKSSQPDIAILGNDNTKNMMIKPPEANLRLLGEKLEKSAIEFTPIVPDKYLGEKIKPKAGRAVAGNVPESSSPQNSKSAIGKALGINFAKLIHSDNGTKASQAHDIQPKGNSVAVSLNA